MTTIGPRAGGIRLIRIVLVAIAFGVTFNSTANVILYLLNHDLATRTSVEARDTRYAICTLRNDLEVRATSSREFLRLHPEGIPGVPVKSLRDSLANQERTIAALSSLDC